MPNYKAHWLAADDDQLRRCIGQGYSAGETGRIMKRSRNSVIGRAHRMGLMFAGDQIGNVEKSKLFWNEERLRKLRELAKAGISRREAARILGCDQTSMGRRIKNLHLVWKEPFYKSVTQPPPPPDDPTPIKVPFKQWLSAPDMPKIGILELDQNTCRWPVGDKLYCGRHVVDPTKGTNITRVYCDYHARKARAAS